VEADEIGRLGSYRVLRPLGMGGMAYVFLAEDIALRRQVALKVMKPELERKADASKRFLREARIMAAIKHQHLATVFQVGQEGEVVYLAMELLHGETLEEWRARVETVKVRDLLRLGREMATGLAVIHQRGLIHRDLKPSNVWLESPGEQVKILDFGLARLVDDDAHFTQAGMIVGTPAFMSPEQACGDKLDVRSDLFSLGAVLYYLCTGAHPFQADNTMAVLAALAVRDPQPVHEINSTLPRALSKLVMQLLAKKAEDRPGTAEEVISSLRQIERGLTRPPVRKEAVSGTVVIPPSGVKKPRSKRRNVSRKRPSRWMIAVAAALALLVFTGGAIVSALAIRSGLKGNPTANAEEKIYLSELQPIHTRNWINRPPPPPDGGPNGPPTPDGRPNGPPPPFDGVRIRGEASPHGLFMHPPFLPTGGRTNLGYRLDKKYRTFEAEVSLNDGPPQSDTRLTFSVLGDGQLLWKSQELWSQAQAQTCKVSVEGVEVLTLQVDCPGHPGGAHAVWVEPCVVK
jgi:serine/threonine protein kinase